jgi:hypothetical protein
MGGSLKLESLHSGIQAWGWWQTIESEVISNDSVLCTIKVVYHQQPYPFLYVYSGCLGDESVCVPGRQRQLVR